MNSINHFLLSFSLGLLFFDQILPMKTILIMTIVFSVFIDVDMIIVLLKNKKDDGHLRTWLQEPLGFFIIFVPIAWVLSFSNAYYFPLVLLIVSSHIIADYMTIHRVKPLSPFWKKHKKIGFIKPYPETGWVKKTKGISEIYILAGNVVFLLLVL